MPKTLVRTLSTALVLAACPLALAAQIGVPSARPLPPMQPRIGIGYAANIPNQLIGVTGHFVTPRVLGGLGVYVDAKFDNSSPEDEVGFEPDLTAREVEETRGDLVFREEGSWQTVNVALMRPLTPQLVAYVGGGVSRGAEYKEFIDQSQQLGNLGFYWVKEDRSSGTRANFIGGVFFQLGTNFGVQMGGESSPAGFTMGATYLLPLR